ncbi:transposase InsO family protein [Bradyrhizobium sp. F1.2.2]
MLLTTRLYNFQERLTALRIPSSLQSAQSSRSGLSARRALWGVRPANDNDLALMRRLDELFTAWPFLGSRRMTAMLKAEGLQVNRKRVQRLMRKMGIAALGPRPNTTRPAPGHKIYPYLLRNMTIDRPNQVWAADITYLPIGRGFLYLVAIIDWASRAVLAWRLSNTMDVSFSVAALDEALAKYGTPEITVDGHQTALSAGHELGATHPRHPALPQVSFVPKTTAHRKWFAGLLRRMVLAQTGPPQAASR